MDINWAFNSATVMPVLWEDELRLWEQFGWRAVEIWHTKIEDHLATGATVGQMAQQLSDAGVTPIGLCVGVLSTRSDGGGSAAEMETLVRRLDLAVAMGAPSVTVIISGQGGDDLSAEYLYLAERLCAAAELAAIRGLRINLEFLGGWPVNGTLGSCIEIVNAANHHALGLLFDFCHHYVSASHLEELPLLNPGHLFLVHVDDSQHQPMERLGSEARCFPGEGRINVLGLIHHLRRIAGYDGYFSIELYDKSLWKLDPLDIMRRTAQSIKVVERKLEQLQS